MTATTVGVLVVTAHPDDPEFLAGGTVAKLAKEGREVTYVIVTNGNKGSGDRTITSQRLAPLREEEQRRAAQVLGVERVASRVGTGTTGLPAVLCSTASIRSPETTSRFPNSSRSTGLITYGKCI